MHPMFAKLYLEADADDLLADGQDKRRRANKARRPRAQRTVQVTGRDRDRQPRR